MKLLATRKTDQNEAVVDPWTVVHFSSGLALGLIDLSLRKALPAAIAYELLEQVLERREVGQKLFVTSGPESLSNAVMDTAVFALGHWLGQNWNGS